MKIDLEQFCTLFEQDMFKIALVWSHIDCKLTLNMTTAVTDIDPEYFELFFSHLHPFLKTIEYMPYNPSKIQILEYELNHYLQDLKESGELLEFLEEKRLTKLGLIK